MNGRHSVSCSELFVCKIFTVNPPLPQGAAVNYLHTKAKVIFLVCFSFGCNYRNVGNTFPRLLNSKVEQKEDTGGHPPFSVIFLAQERGEKRKKKKDLSEMSTKVSSFQRFA